MQYRDLGHTGERVSAVSLGSGGPSQLGQSHGYSTSRISEFVQRAYEAGINLFDTAPVYGDSEKILGRALSQVPRGHYLLATKVSVAIEGVVVQPAHVRNSVHASLSRLETNHIDILQLHGVLPRDYPQVIHTLLPALEKFKSDGDARFIGLTEIPSLDPDHESARRAIADGLFDVVMIAHNLLRPTAERHVLPAAERSGTGVIAMTPIRRGLRDRNELNRRIREAKQKGWIDATSIPEENPLDWLLSRPNVASIPAIGYKFAVANKAVSTVLTGTSNLQHLHENLSAALGPPLEPGDLGRLRAMFQKRDSSYL